jgi:hypothetical protein
MVVFSQEKSTATANKVRASGRGRAGDAVDGISMSKLSGEFSKDNEKGGTKSSPGLEDFPPPRRASGQVCYIPCIYNVTLELSASSFLGKFAQLSLEDVKDINT